MKCFTKTTNNVNLLLCRLNWFPEIAHIATSKTTATQHPVLWQRVVLILKSAPVLNLNSMLLPFNSKFVVHGASVEL